MSPNDFSDYLSRLLGRPVAIDDRVKLSSGQAARVAGWLAERSIASDKIRHLLGSSFRPRELLDGDVREAQPAPTAPVARLHLDGSGGLRIGIDIQRVDELIPADSVSDLKASSELTAIFTLREISYAQSRPESLDTLGGLFAAKEALRKCDTALLPLPLVEVEVLPDATGRPGFPGFSLSISHSGGFAIAVAVTLNGSSRSARAGR